MKYQLRFCQPFQTNHLFIDAGDLAEAACDLLGAHKGRALFIRPADAGRTDGDNTYFALMQAPDGEPFVARYFFGGIGRSGGVKPPANPLQCRSIQEVEQRLGLSAGDLDCDWEGEETSEEALKRKRGPK